MWICGFVCVCVCVSVCVRYLPSALITAIRSPSLPPSWCGRAQAVQRRRAQQIRALLQPHGEAVEFWSGRRAPCAGSGGGAAFTARAFAVRRLVRAAVEGIPALGLAGAEALAASEVPTAGPCGPDPAAICALVNTQVRAVLSPASSLHLPPPSCGDDDHPTQRLSVRPPADRPPQAPPPRCCRGSGASWPTALASRSQAQVRAAASQEVFFPILFFSFFLLFLISFLA